jgi:hypothetical protein
VEPFRLNESDFTNAVAAANQQGLRLATCVVAVYTDEPIDQEVVQAYKGDLRFIGTFPN